MPIEFYTVKVADLRPETPHTIHVRLEGGPSALYEAYRQPGLSIFVRPPGGAAAPVGLASQPERRFFEVLVERASALGKALAGLAPGADVEISAPRGSGFPLLEYRRHDLTIVAHGAGLGPARAATLAALTERPAFGEVRLLVEAHFLDEIPYRDELPSWQRGGVRIYQCLARPDVGKWRRGEQAYVHDLLGDLRLDPERTVVFASGPPDLLQGVQGVLREIDFPPEKLYLFEIEPIVKERPDEPERPAALVEKITKEGIHGSGHHADAPDHAPGYVTPKEQPRGVGLAPYQRV